MTFVFVGDREVSLFSKSFLRHTRLFREVEQMAEHADVLIIGGGVIGLTTAYYLAQAPVRVHVVEQGDFGRQASWAGAGIIPPAHPAHARTPFDRLRALSSTIYPILSEELRARTRLDNGYVVCGGIEVVAAGEASDVEEWGSEGVLCRALNRPAIHDLEPDLDPSLDRAYHLPEMAQVRNPRHLKALLAGCVALGVQLSPYCGVHGLLTQDRRIEAAQTDHGRIEAGQFLVCAGAWTDALLQPLGWQPGVRPVRGQIALLNTGVPRVRPILLHGKRYLVPRPDGRVLVGSTEEDAGFDANPTAGAVAELLAFATALVPSLARARVERCWAGLRPGSADGLPYLGDVPGWDNLYLASGHFRSGIQLSPATGLVMKELLLGQTPSVPLEAFRLDRHATLPGPGAFRS
jgi:glycine oxidase